MLLLTVAVTASGQPTAALQWEPFALRTATGDVEAEVGRLTVPARRGGPDPDTYSLGVVRWRSRGPATAPPLVYLDGGPGGAGYTVAALDDYTRLFQAVRAHRDVILLSPRGTGLSRPRPLCAASSPLPDDFFASEATMTGELTRRAQECAARLRSEGLDLASFNTEEAADDVETLRKALGAEKVALLGFSYGTHAALSVVRRWPNSVERVVLLGTEGPDNTWKLPSTMDRQLERLASESGSDVTGAWRRLLAQAEKSPLTIEVTVSDAPRTLRVGPAALQYILRRDIGDTNDWAMLHDLILRAADGDLALLGRLVARRFGEFSRGVNLLPLAVDCASGAPAAWLEQIRREEPSPFFGRMTNYPFPEACEALSLPMLPEAFRTQVRSAVPALLVSGTHDSNTPPSQGEAVAAGLSRAVHLVVENAGHESTLRPEVQDAIVAFLAGTPVASGRITAPPVTFKR